MRKRPFTTATVGFPRNPRHVSRVIDPAVGHLLTRRVRDQLPR